MRSTRPRRRDRAGASSHRRYWRLARPRRDRDDGARQAAMIGIVAALVRQRTDPYMRTRQDFVEIFDRPPLAEINIGQGRGARRRASLLSPEVSEYRHRPRCPAVAEPAPEVPEDPDRRRRELGDDRAARRRCRARRCERTLAGVLVIWPDYPGTDFDASHARGGRRHPHGPVERGRGLLGRLDRPHVPRQGARRSRGDRRCGAADGCADPVRGRGAGVYSLVDGVLVTFDPSTVRTDTVEAALDEVATMGGQVAGVVVSPVPGRW